MPQTPRQRSFSYFLAESINVRETITIRKLTKCTLPFEEIAARYLAGESSAVLAQEAGVSDRQIRRILSKRGVQTRSAGKPAIHGVNTAFFKTWSPEMAYVLGFIVTDGCVSKSQVLIAQKERYILENIAAAIGTDTPIYTRENNGGTTIIHTLSINRKETVRDMERLGIKPRKSLTVPFPDVPEQYLRHFIRGVIDGDGWVHHKGYVMSVASASRAFAERLTEVFQQRGYNARLVIENRENGATMYRPTVSGKDDIRRLGEWLYADCGDLFLTRKRERFEYHNAS